MNDSEICHVMLDAARHGSGKLVVRHMEEGRSTWMYKKQEADARKTRGQALQESNKMGPKFRWLSQIEM